MPDPTTPIRRPPRPGFRRYQTFVVVRPVRLSRDDRLMPGTVLDGTQLRRHYLRALWRRRRIGPQGHPWTEHMLAAWQAGVVQPEPEQPDEHDDEKPPADEGDDGPEE